MSWFSRKPKPVDVLETLLKIESQKAEMRGQLELRRLELESETIEARAKADLELREWKAQKRERARQLGIKNRENPKRRSSRGTWQKEYCCELGADPLTRNVTIEMIKAHRLHEAGVSSPLESTDGPVTGGPEIPTELGN